MPQTECIKDIAWILSHSIWPVALQSFSYTLFPRTYYLSLPVHEYCYSCEERVEYKWPIYVAYPIYLLGFSSFLLMVVERLNGQSHTSSHRARGTVLMRIGGTESAVRLGTFSEKFIGRDRMPDDAARQLAR